MRIDHAVREVSPQGQALTPIVHSGTVSGTRLSSYGITMPPGHLSRAHVHLGADVLVHVLRGWAATLWGETMQPIRHGAGEQILIPAGVPHAALNLSRKSSVVALEVRTDPHANRDVELLPDLDPIAAARVEDLQNQHRDRNTQATAEGRMPW
ncbi:cupin domain-containing protein [Amycolatopsis sp. NPDC047767]|uniref:cupin domain-containing protein n=1 Tax=Amycolatopsis sp. NPDC047767 TaxID=3156765 RepID=UPI0034573A14